MGMKYLKQKLKDKKILVTGGSGYLGHYLVAELKKLCKEVFVYEKDISTIDRFKKRFDIVCHLAGITKITSETQVRRLFDVNCLGTLSVMRYCAKRRSRLIYASSSSVYSPEYNMTYLREDTALVGPVTLYGVSKAIAEEICRYYAKSFEVPVIVLRIFNMYGPGQDPSFLVPYLIDTLSKDRDITLKTPSAVRDFVYVTDIVNAFISSCAYKCKGLEAFNVGTGSGTNVRDLAGSISSVVGKRLKFRTDKNSSARRDCIVADSTKIKREIGWRPEVSVDEGVKLCFYGTRNK